MQGETFPYSPTSFGRHSALTSCRASTLARKYEFVSELPQKIPARSFRKRAGQYAVQKQRSFLSVSLILRRLNGTASNAGFLARFVARVLCLPGLPSGLLSKSRSPYSCGTAQVLHLFFRNRGALSYFIVRAKSGRTRPLPCAYRFFPHYKRMILILQYRYPYGYIHEKSSEKS